MLKPKDWVKDIEVGQTIMLGFMGADASEVPHKLHFTSLLPPEDPNNDPSLLTRGTFGTKVSQRCRVIGWSHLSGCEAGALIVWAAASGRGLRGVRPLLPVACKFRSALSS